LELGLRKELEHGNFYANGANTTLTIVATVPHHWVYANTAVISGTNTDIS
jgi:hypothetical protein